VIYVDIREDNGITDIRVNTIIKIISKEIARSLARLASKHKL
jgi:hypothetical protein